MRSAGNVASAVALAAILAGCAGFRPVEAAPVPEYARGSGVWTAEVLHRDLLTCLDASQTAVLADFSRYRAHGTAAHALRDRTTECMNRKGWVRR